MQELQTFIPQVAATASTALILGETGTGKELVACAIHEQSPRREHPMIKVNCAAFPANLIESDLFGHEKGAFTGATDTRIGKFELAHNGTLFLDEIGEMPLQLQAKLLRVLQEKEIERVGGRAPIRINARIIAATNRDLMQEVRAGRFRSDLYFRLHVIPITVPSLRDRPADIPLLATHFLQQQAVRNNSTVKAFSPAAMQQLLHYHWPGNIRELEHLVERSVLLCSHHLIPHVPLPPASTPPNAGNRTKTLDEIMREHIIQVLRQCQGKVSGPDGAAALLQIPSTTLSSKIRRLKIARTV